MMPKWNFESFTILGMVSTEYCTIQGDYASVMIPYEEYLETAKKRSMRSYPENPVIRSMHQQLILHF